MSDNATPTQTFASLFKATGRTFRIPEYQRAYSWGENQIKQFLDDLREAQKPYYLGHFLFEQPEAGKSNELLVIDGQQRLTTCILFFSILNRQLDALGKENSLPAEVAGWHNVFLGDETTNYRPKLITVNYDNHFFEELLTADRSVLQCLDEQLESKSQRLLHEAYTEINKVVKATEIDKLSSWGSLIAGANITYQIVKDKKEAAQLFAFQNDRGKSLTALETVKSYLMLQVLLFGQDEESPARMLPLLEREFEFIYRRLTTVELTEDEVLTYYWRSRLPHPYQDTPVVESIKGTVAALKPAERSAWVQRFVKELALAFEHVEEIEQDDDEYARDLRTLDRMALAYPLLLRAYRDGITAPTKKRLFRFLENITFRYKLRSGRARMHDRFDHCFFGDDQLVLDDAELDRRIDNFVHELRTSWWYGFWNDQEVFGVLDSYFYGNPVDNYVLWKYERALAVPDMPSTISYGQVMQQESIEHIAPQNPREADSENPNWQRDYGPYRHDTQPSEGLETGGWLNKLGNLMLLSQSQNSRASNRPFKEKLALYKSTGQLKQQHLEDFLTCDPVTEQRVYVWDRAAIESRHNDILTKVRTIWDLSNISPIRVE